MAQNRTDFKNVDPGEGLTVGRRKSRATKSWLACSELSRVETTPAGLVIINNVLFYDSCKGAKTPRAFLYLNYISLRLSGFA
jgi:hypothetical protein